MKKFSFRLEPVLKYKNDRLEVLKNEHAKIVNKIMKQEEKIKELENSRRQYEVAFNQKKLQGILPIEAINYQNYLDRQNYIIKREYTVLKKIRDEESEKKDQILEAKKESLSIEKLKEINMEQYRKDVNRENELFIEEFVSNSRASVRSF
ncbi:MAG: flagellar export protein FliJ [Clostridiales bacterium]|nr:flagellar export protein FliJ [Clostridiales bacterium]